jgi:hypothetical protein
LGYWALPVSIPVGKNEKMIRDALEVEQMYVMAKLVLSIDCDVSFVLLKMPFHVLCIVVIE